MVFFLLGHMGCLAFLAAIFVVAAVDDPAVFIVAVPDLGSKTPTALTAFYLAGENAHAAVSAAVLLAPCNLVLRFLLAHASSLGRIFHPYLRISLGSFLVLRHNSDKGMGNIQFLQIGDVLCREFQVNRLDRPLYMM